MFSTKSRGSLRAVVAVIIAGLAVFAVPVTAQAATDVTDLAGLKAAFANGGDINIAADITSTEPLLIPAGKEVTMSSTGNKTITLDPTKLIGVKGKLNIGNGITINASEAMAAVGATGENALLSISGGTINCNNCIATVGLKEKARANVSGGTFNSTHGAGNAVALFLRVRVTAVFPVGCLTQKTLPTITLSH